jgi:hypothetical protein
MFCSFKVRSPDVLPIPGQTNILDTGINVFSAEVPDVDVFKAELQALGVEVLEVHHLNVTERVTLKDLLLPGEEKLLTEAELAGKLSDGLLALGSGVLSGSERPKT